MALRATKGDENLCDGDGESCGIYIDGASGAEVALAVEKLRPFACLIRSLQQNR
jgi:hypothetical protein